MLVFGLVLSTVFVVVALFAPWIAPYGWAQQSVDGVDFGTQQPPNPLNIWGTTVSGFDVYSRVIWGAQTAFLVIVFAVLFSIFVGIFLGLVSGYFGGWLDRILVVIADAIYALPVAAPGDRALDRDLAAASRTCGAASCSTALAITVVFVPQYFRVIRAEVVRIKAEPFVESARGHRGADPPHPDRVTCSATRPARSPSS